MVRDLTRATTGCFLLFIFSAAACGGSERPGQSDSTGWTAATDTIGDTIIVHTVAGSQLGALRLLEEIRIGAVDGEDHELFGDIAALAVTPSGDILIYDRQASEIRRFTSTGSYVGTLGRAGAGPGEYQDVVGCCLRLAHEQTRGDDGRSASTAR